MRKLHSSGPRQVQNTQSLIQCQIIPRSRRKSSQIPYLMFSTVRLAATRLPQRARRNPGGIQLPSQPRLRRVAAVPVGRIGRQPQRLQRRLWRTTSTVATFTQAGAAAELRRPAVAPQAGGTPTGATAARPRRPRVLLHLGAPGILRATARVPPPPRRRLAEFPRVGGIPARAGIT